MSKAVLISIRPEWCEKIVSGRKTLELRKTAPTIKPPFKCYIYCTKFKYGEILCFPQWKTGKVIGEFNEVAFELRDVGQHDHGEQILQNRLGDVDDVGRTAFQHVGNIRDDTDGVFADDSNNSTHKKYSFDYRS